MGNGLWLLTLLLFTEEETIYPMMRHYSNAQQIKRSILWQEHFKFNMFYLHVQVFDSSWLEQKHK